MSEEVSGQVSEQEKESIENALKCLEMDMLDNTQIELLLNYIGELQKENKELIESIEDKIEGLESTKLCGGAVNKAICEEKIQLLKNILEWRN